MPESQPVPRPPAVKYAVWVNCAALIIGGFISFIVNIVNFLDPTLPVLSAYMCVFGVIALGAELNFSIVAKYFGFLHDWVGEAVFFIFVGTLGIAQGTSGILALVIGIISCVTGVMCVIEHYMCVRKFFFKESAAPAAAGAAVAAAA